jgi:hypothetical protein
LKKAVDLPWGSRSGRLSINTEQSRRPRCRRSPRRMSCPGCLCTGSYNSPWYRPRPVHRPGRNRGKALVAKVRGEAAFGGCIPIDGPLCLRFYFTTLTIGGILSLTYGTRIFSLTFCSAIVEKSWGLFCSLRLDNTEKQFGPGLGRRIIILGSVRLSAEKTANMVTVVEAGDVHPP